MNVLAAPRPVVVPERPGTFDGYRQDICDPKHKNRPHKGCQQRALARRLRACYRAGSHRGGARAQKV